MTAQIVLRAPVAKRREITSELNHHNLSTVRLSRALEHVDGTIRVFTGEPAQRLLSALWVARKPLTVDQLAAQVGIAPKQAGAVLRYLADCGLVRCERARGQTATWHAVY